MRKFLVALGILCAVLVSVPAIAGSAGDGTFEDVDGDGIDDDFDPNIGQNDAVDTDGDGIYDAYDTDNGFTDADGNGVGDGLQDFDGDGTADFQEYVHDSGDAGDIPGFDEQGTFGYDPVVGTVPGPLSAACSVSNASNPATPTALLFGLLFAVGLVYRRRTQL